MHAFSVARSPPPRCLAPPPPPSGSASEDSRAAGLLCSQPVLGPGCGAGGHTRDRQIQGSAAQVSEGEVGGACHDLPGSCGVVCVWGPWHAGPMSCVCGGAMSP